MKGKEKSELCTKGTPEIQRHKYITNLGVTTIGKDYHTMEEISLNKNYKMKMKIEATKTQESKQEME